MKHRLNYILHRKPIHAFTLVELLVVISIIALLMSILMPSLNKARKQATRIDCAVRLRQQGIALSTYAQDYKGKYPPAVPPGAWPMGAMTDNYGASDDNPVGSPILVVEEYLNNYKMLYCPQQDKTYKHRRSFCLSSENWHPDFWSITYISYPYWVGYAHQVTTTSKKTMPVLLSKLTAAEAISDGTTVVSSDLIIVLPGTYYWDAISNHEASRNVPAGGNILYNDMHVKWKNFKGMEKRFYYVYEFYF